MRTKGKWSVVSNGVEIYAGEILIADCYPEEELVELPIKEAQVNAEFICKAVNAHDDLVKALDALKRLSALQDRMIVVYRIGKRNIGNLPDQLQSAREKVEKALKLAEGEK